MCMAHILIKMAPSLDGSNHAAVRYSIQIVVMLIFIKKNDLEMLGPKSQRNLLLLRAVVGSLAVMIGFFSIKYLDVSDVETLTNSCVIITAIISRVVLKEKLTVCHIVTLFLTVSGVMFIVRPSFLFGIEQNLENFFHLNLSTVHSHLNSNQTIKHVEIKDHLNRSFYETIIGVSMVLLSAVCMSVAQVSIRKLCLVKVHFAITSLYPALVGLPASLIVSAILIQTSTSHQNLNQEADILPIQIGYSICAGVFGTMGIIFLNNALRFEDATKIGMIKTIGVFFSFILQFLFLDITVDFLGVMGAIFIVTGTISTMVIKLFDKPLSQSEIILVKILIKKF